MPKEYIEREALFMDLSETLIFSGRPGEASAEVRGANKVISRIKNAPTADVVEVIRCKDCKTWDIEHISCEGFARCINGESGVRYRRRDDFCSYGERRIK